MPMRDPNAMREMILITDAHVGETQGNAAEFFEMLDRLGADDRDLAFLGDIFDLWIALPGYEGPIHREFCAWCRRQKRRRRIGFMEGNHEFFVARERADVFSWCTDAPWRREHGGLLFVHGDLVNRRDFNHRAFRKLSKSPLSRSFLRHAPRGPAFAAALKRRLRYANRKFRTGLPEGEIRRFAEERLSAGVHTILVGHFHTGQSYQGTRLHLLPDWHSSKSLALLDPGDGTLSQMHWRELRG
jgi:UDP-2,3-diacylglucosamine pyrophosphatase LpxH